MEIPISLELIVEVLLFIIAGIGGILSYLILDLRKDLKGTWVVLDGIRKELTEIRIKVDKLETRINICQKCP